MRIARPNQVALLRCADAAGYGAVSWLDDEADRRPIHKIGGHGFWRAALVLLFFVI